MESIKEFLDMGGYGFYVWTSYGLTLVVMVLSFWLPRKKERELLRSLRRRQQREEQQS